MERDLVLLLDEPDAYLPPVGVQSLLARLLGVCLTRNWSVVISTHSEEMIALSMEHESFTLLSIDQHGQPSACTQQMIPWWRPVSYRARPWTPSHSLRTSRPAPSREGFSLRSIP